jgi:hypothetical protein
MSPYKIAMVAVVAITIQLSVFAQETPAGKKTAETFWKAIAENRPVQAKTSLESIKRREPNFDASKMEKALADLLAQRDSASTSARNDSRARNEAGQLLNSIFARTPKSGNFEKSEVVKAAIAENSKIREQILAMDRALIQRDLDSAQQNVKSALLADAQKNADLLKRINESIEAGKSESLYNELLFRQAFWENAAKIFPDEAEIATAYGSIAKTIRDLGTPEQLAAKAAANLNARIDAERLPRAAISDAKLEKWFRDVFTETSQQRNRNYTFLKAVILDANYAIKRNEVTGVILGRSRGAAIAFKDQDGKCKWGIYAITQDYAGGSFSGSGTLSMDFDHKEIRCGNVK